MGYGWVFDERLFAAGLIAAGAPVFHWQALRAPAETGQRKRDVVFATASLFFVWIYGLANHAMQPGWFY